MGRKAADAKTVALKLKETYGLVLESIAKPSSYVPFMMPKRLAETPADPGADWIRSLQIREVTAIFCCHSYLGVMTPTPIAVLNRH
jgi:hypothetical protein